MQWIVSLTPEVGHDLLESIKTPPPEAAVVEVRLDLFPDFDLSSAVASCPLPVLATLRSTPEGGRGPTEKSQRLKRLTAARDAGAAMIDVEWLRDREIIPALGLAPEQIVLSWHDPLGTPAGLEDQVVEMLNAGSGTWVKAVTTANSFSDLERVLSLYCSHKIPKAADQHRIVAFAMGAIGMPSRYLAPLLGAPMGFAAWTAAAAAAPGQVQVARMEAAVGHLSAPPRRLFAVIGADVSSSLSPTLHGAAFRAAGRPDCLVPVNVPDVDSLEHLFAPRGQTIFDRCGLTPGGWAVTTPYKGEAARAATVQAPRVKRAGAANTLLLRSGEVIAENTDADGVVGALTALGTRVEGTTVLVQGTGGAARGAAIGLMLAGANVVLRSRFDENAQRLAAELEVGSLCKCDGEGAEILVNATPLGQHPGDNLPFSRPEIERASAVVDMVYQENDTELVTLSRRAGLAVVDGTTMLAYQGIAQHAAFVAAIPPREAIFEALGLPSPPA